MLTAAHIFFPSVSKAWQGPADGWHERMFVPGLVAAAPPGAPVAPAGNGQGSMDEARQSTCRYVGGYDSAGKQFAHICSPMSPILA